MIAPYPYTKHPVNKFRDSNDSHYQPHAGLGCGLILAAVTFGVIIGSVLGFIAGRTAC